MFKNRATYSVNTKNKVLEMELKGYSNAGGKHKKTKHK